MSVKLFKDAELFRGKSNFALEGELGVATVVQFGGVEIHGWNTVLPNLNHPDRMIFDLDPDETLPFATVKSASVHIKNYLDAANLMSWPLLSGGKGIHVVVPLNCTNSEEDVEFFCSAFAKRVAAERPELFVATISKTKRTGKILIDYLRNRKMATAIIPWSIRARPGSPIAAPVSWTTLSKFKSARAFDVINIPPSDPWTSFWTTDQAISHEVITMLKRSMNGTR
jgi:bifunctional non-homologous end joining protein LigD